TLGQLPDPEGLGHAPTFTTQMAGGHVQIPPPQLSLAQQQLPTAPPSTNWGGVVSPKMAEKILKGHFVDMIELLPDAWRYEDTAAQLPIPRPPVMEIKVLVKCFSLMAGVIISRYPEKAQHMFQYLRTIMRASQNFEGTTWVSYDEPSGDRLPPKGRSIGELLMPLCITRPSLVKLKFVGGVLTA
uniref:Uncharacterized protein n=1 Tax=Amphimedon queenslandica TaxID=400682 RepID=A0A1X7UVP8_AMPQE